MTTSLLELQAEKQRVSEAYMHFSSKVDEALGSGAAFEIMGLVTNWMKLRELQDAIQKAKLEKAA